MAKDDDLRKRAQELLETRRSDSEQPMRVEEGADSLPPRTLPKTKHRAGEIARAAAAPGAGILAVITLLTQLLSSRVTPEQLTALRERVQKIEDERTDRRTWEYERDRIRFCRDQQQDNRLISLLPPADQRVGPPPKPWFDVCPDPIEPSTGTKVIPAAK